MALFGEDGDNQLGVLYPGLSDPALQTKDHPWKFHGILTTIPLPS